jgi:hypothetical protein
MYRNGGDVKVDGEVRNVWTQKVFQKMIENNNKIISSPELSGLTSNSVWKSLGAGNRRIWTRSGLAKELLVNNMQSDSARYQQSIEVAATTRFPLVVDFTESVDKFYKCFVEFDNGTGYEQIVTSAYLLYFCRYGSTGLDGG